MLETRSERLKLVALDARLAGLQSRAPAAFFEALGVQDVVAKSVGSSNPHNMIRATFEALERSASPRMVAQRRGKKVSDILGKRDTAAAEARE